MRSFWKRAWPVLTVYAAIEAVYWAGYFLGVRPSWDEWLLMVLSVVAAIWVFKSIEYYERKKMPTQNVARLEAAPGARLILYRDGTCVAVVMLHTVTQSMQGVTVEFVDYLSYINSRTYRG